MNYKTLLSATLFAFSAIVIGLPITTFAATLTRDLQLGMSGADVTAVQTFLSQDAALYPQAMVTGYFGSYTQAAVTNFQLRNEIPAVGRIGPMTRPIMDLQISTGMYSGLGMGTIPGIYTGADVNAPIITGTNVFTTKNSSTVTWNTNESATGIVYYSTSPLSLNERMTSVDVGGSSALSDTNLRTSQNVMISGLLANTKYYYLIYSADQFGNVTITWPSTFQTAN